MRNLGLVKDQKFESKVNEIGFGATERPVTGVFVITLISRSFETAIYFIIHVVSEGGVGAQGHRGQS